MDIFEEQNLVSKLIIRNAGFYQRGVYQGQSKVEQDFMIVLNWRFDSNVRSIPLLYILCFLFIFTSCGNGKVENERLLRAETLMASSPDSSYRILQSVLPEILCKSEQMYYGLLLAEATDKKYLSLLPCDSLLNEAIHYYGSGIHLAKALMYKGRLQFRLSMCEEAMENYFSALKQLDGEDKEELRMKGLVYKDLGDLYSAQVLIGKSAEMYRKSEECFRRCGYKKGLSIVANDIGWNHLLEGDTLRARESIKLGLKHAFEIKDSVTISALCHNLSCTYEEVDSMLHYEKKSFAFREGMAFKSAIMIGYAFINQERMDSAEYYFRQALHDTILETRALAYYGLKDVKEMQGEYQQALEHLSDYSAVMDSIYFFKQSPEIERKAYEQEAQMKVYEDKIRMERLHFCLITFCLLLVLFFVWMMQRGKRQRKYLELKHKYDIALLEVNARELQCYISSLREEQEEARKQISQKDSEIRRLADEKAKLCNVIFKETSIYKKIEKLSRQKRNGNKQEIHILLEDEQNQLRITIMELYKDYIAHLLHIYPKYTENDCLFSCLSLCGLDDFTIALCFGNVNSQIVVQRRHRMKLKSGK